MSVFVLPSQLSTMSPALLNKIPEEVREHVKMLLSVTPTVRPDADQMTKVCFVNSTMQQQCILQLLVMVVLIITFV